MKKWKKLKSSLVYASKYFKVRKDIVLLPDGSEKEWSYWDSKDSAMVLGITKNNKLIMIRQYRYLVGREVIEFPSGGLLDNESPSVGAAREFEEETGYECKKLVKLGVFYETYGQLNRKIFIFFTKSVKQTRQSLDSGKKGFEEIKVELVPLNKVLEFAIKGKIDSIGSSLAVLLLKEKVERGEVAV